MTCPECGEQFEPHNGKQVYCTTKCQRINSNWRTNEKQKQQRLANPSAPHPKRKCAVCGTEFVPVQKSHWQRYCSPKCNQKASHAKKQKRRKYVGSTDAKECGQCKKPILATGLCYDCFNPGGRYIARAAWLFGNNRSRRLNPAA